MPLRHFQLAGASLPLRGCLHASYEFLFVHRLVFELLSLLLLHFIEYLVLLDVSSTAQHTVALQTREQLVCFFFFAALDAWQGVELVIVKGLHGAISMHSPLFRQ